MIEGIVPSCPKCGCGRTLRVQRKGWMQTVVLHRFGLYPWECVGCRGVFTFKNRGRVRRRRHDSESEVRVQASVPLQTRVQIQTRVNFQTKLSSVSVYPENLRF